MMKKFVLCAVLAAGVASVTAATPSKEIELDGAYDLAQWKIGDTLGLDVIAKINAEKERIDNKEHLITQ